MGREEIRQYLDAGTYINAMPDSPLRTQLLDVLRANNDILGEDDDA